MSASKPANREEFINYCLRRLGAPVIQINVARQQVEDLVDEALQLFHYEHYNGSIRVYLPVEATAQVLKDGYFPVDDKIISIHRVLETSSASSGQFTAEYQLMSQTYPFALSGDGLVSYSLALQYLETLKSVASGKTKIIRFNRHMDKLFIDVSWGQVKEGQIFVVEAAMRLDPEEYPQVWNDNFLKRYCTALIKRQWGNNLRKLQNVQLVGGVQIDGQQILQEAQEEIENYRQQMTIDHQAQLGFFMQ